MGEKNTLPWSFHISDQEIEQTIAEYRETPKGKQDKRPLAELYPLAVNSIIRLRGKCLQD